MAKQFVFKLETLLKIRREREDRQKRVVADRLRQIARVQAEIGEFERQIVAQIDAMRVDATSSRLDVSHLARNRHWLTHLYRGRLEAQGRLRLLEARLAQERAVLAHASKEKKVLEKLKEKRYEQYHMELERQERIEDDERTTARFAAAMAVARASEL